ncbi:MAG TPA: hypothetical protein VMH40_10475 [Myxococcaceae bacterium]|nr:hypothetical protein [Myxococcaceae bacterium]
MARRWTAIVSLASLAILLGGWDCGSGGGEDGGVSPTHSTCDLSATFTGPCLVTLTGAANLSFACKPIYAIYDPTDGTLGSTSMVQIGASNARNPDGGVGVSSINVTLKWAGPPAAGTMPTLTQATAASKPNNILLFLDDPLGSTFQSVYPTQSMQFTVNKAAMASTGDAGSGRSFWCIDGQLTSDVPNLSDPSSVIHLSLGFDAGV